MQQSFNMEQANYTIQTLKDTKTTVRGKSSRLHPSTIQFKVREFSTFFAPFFYYLGRCHENWPQGHEASVQEGGH